MVFYDEDDPEGEQEFDFEMIKKVRKDHAEAAKQLGLYELRTLVKLYYDFQEQRTTASKRIKSNMRNPLAKTETNRCVGWAWKNSWVIECTIKKWLDIFTSEYAVGQWLKAIVGIGPVNAAGCMAHLDPRHAVTVGQWYAFSGLSPTIVWEKGQKRPFNMTLKTLLAYKVGECFVKTYDLERFPDAYYGPIYKARKQVETAKNLHGDFKSQADAALLKKKFREDKVAYKAYKEGILPLGHIHARARRYAVKLFVSHYHHVAHMDYFGVPPSVPFGCSDPIQIAAGHTRFIPPPNFPFTAKPPAKTLRQFYEREGDEGSHFTLPQRKPKAPPDTAEADDE